MKKLFALLLMLFTLVPCIATGIDIRKEGSVHHGGTRIPSTTRVSADYESGTITIGINGYTGGVQVFVSDSQGNVVGSTMSSIANNGIVSLNLESLAEGGYSLDIILDNDTYYGQFDV